MIATSYCVNVLHTTFLAPGELVLTLNGEVLQYHGGKAGTYILASHIFNQPPDACLKNSKPYWVTKDQKHAIWYDSDPEFCSWNIGLLGNVGSSQCVITSQ